MIHKTLSTFQKPVSERTVEGFAAVFGNADDGDDRIWPGAFTKTLAEGGKRVRHLWMHNSWEPPTAVIRELAEVGRDALPLEMLARFPDAVGALKVSREYLDTPRGNEILAGIKAGAIDELSIGFDLVPGKFDVTTDASGRSSRIIREARLWDTSDVTWGMNAATQNLKALYASSTSPLAHLEDFAQTLKAGRVLSADNVARIEDALRILNELLAQAKPADEAAKAAHTAAGTLQRLRLVNAQLMREAV